MMPILRLEDTSIAELLMHDYGVSRQHTEEVKVKVAAARQRGLIHCLIAASVRGYAPDSRTDELKAFLETHKTHPPLHHARVE